jgi:hypothetical protein
LTVDGPVEVGSTVCVTVTVGAGVAVSSGEGEAVLSGEGLRVTESVADGEGDDDGESEGVDEGEDPPVSGGKVKESHNYATSQIPRERPNIMATARPTTHKNSEILIGERNSGDLPATIE